EVVRLSDDGDPGNRPGGHSPSEQDGIASPKEVALLRGSHLDLGQDGEPPLGLAAPDRRCQAHTVIRACDASANSFSFSLARPESIVSCAFSIPSCGLEAAPATYSAYALLST